MRTHFVAVLLSGLVLAAPLQGQNTYWSPLSTAGVFRATAAVDSVFLDRIADEATVDGGDWAAYLMARLGVYPIPDMGFGVAVDSSRLLLAGRVGDLPPEARAILAPLFLLTGPDARVAAEIHLLAPAPRLVRFHLRAVTLNGVTVPDILVQTVMMQVGRYYPVLTASGRDLYVEIPEGGRVLLVPGGVRLVVEVALGET